MQIQCWHCWLRKHWHSCWDNSASLHSHGKYKSPIRHWWKWPPTVCPADVAGTCWSQCSGKLDGGLYILQYLLLVLDIHILTATLVHGHDGARRKKLVLSLLACPNHIIFLFISLCRGSLALDALKKLGIHSPTFCKEQVSPYSLWGQEVEMKLNSVSRNLFRTCCLSHPYSASIFIDFGVTFESHSFCNWPSSVLKKHLFSVCFENSRNDCEKIRPWLKRVLLLVHCLVLHQFWNV